MKAKNFGKLIALALCVAMAFSMSATAFATGPSEVNTGDVDYETVAIGGGLSVAGINADGQLAPSTWEMYSIGERTAGQIIRIQASWYPKTANMHIGLIKAGATETNLYNGTDGSVDIVTTIPVDGTYYLMIANPSTATTLTDIHWTVSVYNPA